MVAEWNGRRQEGFTLIEMIVVIAVIGIVSAIAIPNYLASLPEKRLKSAARDLHSNLQKARISAVKNNQKWAVTFDTGGEKYSVCSSWVSSTDHTVEETIDLQDYPGVEYQSVTVSPIVFKPQGTGTAGIATLKNNKGTEFDIETLVSGLITLERKS